MVSKSQKPLKSYKDLSIYKNLYDAMLIVLKEIAPFLPREEKYDLASQMRRGCKAPPARIAEAWAKRYQKRQWSKNLDDTLGECYEMINHLDVCLDVYAKYLKTSKCMKAHDLYEISCKQIVKLKQNWQNYHDKKI